MCRVLRVSRSGYHAWLGWLFLAMVIDLFSRKVVVWSMADHMRTEFVLNAFHCAAGRRLATSGLLLGGDELVTDWTHVAHRQL